MGLEEKEKNERKGFFKKYLLYLSFLQKDSEKKIHVQVVDLEGNNFRGSRKKIRSKKGKRRYLRQESQRLQLP